MHQCETIQETMTCHYLERRKIWLSAETDEVCWQARLHRRAMSLRKISTPKRINFAKFRRQLKLLIKKLIYKESQLYRKDRAKASAINSKAMFSYTFRLNYQITQKATQRTE